MKRKTSMANPQKPSQFAKWRAARKERWEKSWFANTRLGKWLRSLFGSMGKSAAETVSSSGEAGNSMPAPPLSDNTVKTEPVSTDTSVDSGEQPYTTSHQNLNKDTALLISNQLSLTDAASLAQVDRFFSQTTKDRVQERIQAKAHELVEHIALGRLVEAEKMVKANPRLLYLKAKKVKDYAGHEIIGADGTGVTAYECALGAGFVKAAEMLAGYFTDEEERLRQHKRQLPNGWIYEGETRFTEDYADALIEEILKSSDAAVSAALLHKRNQVPPENRTQLRETLDVFREKLAPHPQVKAGKHINHQNLINGLVRYAACWQDNRWTLDKYRLYCRQVLGFMGRDESAGVAKYLAQGLCNIAADDVVPSNFDFSEGGGSYFPLPDDDVGLGFESWADFYHGRSDPHASILPGPRRRAAELEKFLGAIASSLRQLSRPVEPTKNSGCVMC
jgi:hypothetical protein